LYNCKQLQVLYLSQAATQGTNCTVLYKKIVPDPTGCPGHHHSSNNQHFLTTILPFLPRIHDFCTPAHI
jgi:hypothetical protein